MNIKKHSTQSDVGNGNSTVVEEPGNGSENITGNVDVINVTNLDGLAKDFKPKEKDIMKYEPVLTSMIVDSYDGETDEFGFFHGQGIAFFHGGMSYNGTFAHGKMHGQGVLKWSNGMIYTGDIINNALTGSGAYSWPDGSLYEGEVFNGLRHGFGTFKCGNDKSYTGQWKDGKRHGKGILYFDSTGDSYYDGDWAENERCGYGIRRFTNGNMYEGHWMNNQRHGEGRMYWYNVGQEYFGNWVNGIQNGYGENIWYLKRIESSQYPLRNHYIGHFMDGERHGTGTFYFASGAHYEGDWKHNMKHGHGKFTFKNGCIFSGEFREDRMVKYPDLILSGMTTPDISKSGIPVKSPLSERSDSVIGNDNNPLLLDVDIDDLLLECKYDPEQREEEMNNIAHIILRHTTLIKQLYKIYSSLGVGISVDNTFVMSKLQFLSFLRDFNICDMNHTLHQINKTVDKEEESVEDCFRKIFIRDFLTNLIQISYLVYLNSSPPGGDKLLLSACFAKLIGKLNEQGTAAVKEMTFQSMEKYQEVIQYLSKCFDIYRYYSRNGIVLTKRNVMFIYKELGLITPQLSTTALVQILVKEDMIDGCFNLDTEITFLEFLEILIASSSIFINNQMLHQHYVTERNFAIGLPILEVVPMDDITDADKDSQPVVIVEDHVTEQASSEKAAEEITSLDPLDASPSKSSGVTTVQKVSSRSSKRSKKSDKETSHATLHSKSKEKKEHSRTEKKASQLKQEESKMKTLPSNVKKNDSTETNVPKKDSIHPESVIDSVNDEKKVLSGDQNVIVSSTHKTLNSVETTTSAQAGRLSDTQEAMAPLESSLLSEPIDDFNTWALKLNLFFNNHLFPSYEKRKEMETKHASLQIGMLAC